MRNLVMGVAAIAVAFGVASCGKKEEAAKDGAAAVAEAPAGTPMNPKRKPGLWEQSMAMDGQPATMTMKRCLDEATDAQMSAFGNAQAKDTCPDQSVTKSPDGSWVFSSTCNMGTGGTVKSTGQATGDFNSNYTVEASTETTGAAAPQMNAAHKMTMNAKWIGTCPEGMKAGDVDMGGMTINMTQMKAMQGAKTPAPK